MTIVLAADAVPDVEARGLALRIPLHGEGLAGRILRGSRPPRRSSK
jgi:hypothetical protein